MPQKLSILLACLLCLSSSRVFAETVDTQADFQIGLIRYNGNWNPRPSGLKRLAWEIRRRTSVAVDMEPTPVDPTSGALFDFPLLAWQGDQGFDRLPDSAILQLRQHLTMGGTLWVDISDGLPEGPFFSSVQRELQRILPSEHLIRVPSDHVIYKSFYLLDRHGGRVMARPNLDGIWIANRLAVVVTYNDIAGAMARDAFGRWEYDIAQGGDSAREISFRFSINLAMYALCLDYKEDQVHIPFILQRRR